MSQQPLGEWERKPGKLIWRKLPDSLIQDTGIAEAWETASSVQTSNADEEVILGISRIHPPGQMWDGVITIGRAEFELPEFRAVHEAEAMILMEREARIWFWRRLADVCGAKDWLDVEAAREAMHWSIDQYAETLR